MSLNNLNESDDSLLDLSKESKKRRNRKRAKDTQGKNLASTTPILFKNVELELPSSLMSYIHKLEFLIDKTYNQLHTERDSFTDILLTISKHFDCPVLPLLEDLSSPELETARKFDFNSEILKKYDPSLIPQASQMLMKSQKSRTKKQPAPQAQMLVPNENYNIIKFSLSKDKAPVNEEIPAPSSNHGKKGRRRGSANEKPGNFGRKKLKKEDMNENSSNFQQKIKEIPMQNNGFMNPVAQNQFNNLMFSNNNSNNMFNPQALVAPQFGFLNGNMMIPGQEQENNGLPTFNNSTLANFYALLNDPNKDLMGLLNSNVLQDPNELIKGAHLWAGQFGLDPNFIKSLEEHNKNN